MTDAEKQKIREKILDGSIYSDPRYTKWRQAVFERDRFTCQMTNEPGGHLEAHHIKPKYKYPELIFDVKNGITLRKYMHQYIHKEDLAQKFEKKFQQLAKTNKAKKRVKKVVQKLKAFGRIKRQRKNNLRRRKK